MARGPPTWQGARGGILAPPPLASPTLDGSMRSMEEREGKEDNIKHGALIIPKMTFIYV